MSLIYGVMILNALICVPLIHRATILNIFVCAHAYMSLAHMVIIVNALVL